MDFGNIMVNQRFIQIHLDKTKSQFSQICFYSIAIKNTDLYKWKYFICTHWYSANNYLQKYICPNMEKMSVSNTLLVQEQIKTPNEKGSSNTTTRGRYS